jgi:YXWGXW repeat-containing protein
MHRAFTAARWAIHADGPSHQEITMLKRLLLFLAVATAPSIAAAQVSVRLTVPEVRVRVAPPEARVEVRPDRPSPHHQWAAGHWAPRNNTNVWVAGEWTAAPREGMVWEDAHWAQRNGSSYYTEGHWRWENDASPAEVYEPPAQQEPVVVTQRPPRNFDEVRPGRPFRGAVWIPGFWYWNGGQHLWVAGRWSAPRQGYAWTPDRWQRDNRRGHDGRWVLAPGHWRRR